MGPKALLNRQERENNEPEQGTYHKIIEIEFREPQLDISPTEGTLFNCHSSAVDDPEDKISKKRF